MGMKWKYTRIITLFALIILSLFLSWRMWTAGGGLGESQSPPRVATPSLTFERSKTHVFGPTQIVVHEHQGKRASTNLQMLSQIQKGMSQWEITAIEEPIQISKQAYQDMMERIVGVELVFEGQTPFGLFEKSFNRMPREYEDRTFNRAFIPLNNPEKLYFYDSVTHMFFDTSVEKITKEDIDGLAYNEEAEYKAVEAVQLKNQHIYLPTETSQVSYQDYLIERLPNSLFVNFFFTDTSNVDVRRTENATRYLDYVSELRINEKNNLLTYRKQQSTNRTIGLGERLNRAFNELTQVEKWTEEIHYHNYNPDTKTITFRRYLGGLPVFGYFDYGEVQIRSGEDSLTYLRLPLEVVQTPIAQVEEDPSVTLPSGPQIIAQLEAEGVSLLEVENIRLGLSWERSEESNQVVRFSPNWYVLEKGKWFELSRYVTRQGGELPDGL